MNSRLNGRASERGSEGAKCGAAVSDGDLPAELFDPPSFLRSGPLALPAYFVCILHGDRVASVRRPSSAPSRHKLLFVVIQQILLERIEGEREREREIETGREGRKERPIEQGENDRLRNTWLRPPRE